MKTHLHQLFTYDLWANQRILNSLLKNPIADEKCIFWINHIVNAEIIWIDRILGKPMKVSPAQVRPIGEVAEVMNSVHAEIMAFIETGDLRGEILYQNTRGDEFRNSTQDILTHVANHSTHHRAQIAARIREMGIAPPPTDYIVFLRNS